jgi:hypothetical protein
VSDGVALTIKLSDRRLGRLGLGGVDVEQGGATVEDRPLRAIALDDQRIVGGIGHQTYLCLEGKGLDRLV